jgi:hypothetical protein
VEALVARGGSRSIPGTRFVAEPTPWRRRGAAAFGAAVQPAAEHDLLR